MPRFSLYDFFHSGPVSGLAGLELLTEAAWRGSDRTETCETRVLSVLGASLEKYLESLLILTQLSVLCSNSVHCQLYRRWPALLYTF